MHTTHTSRSQSRGRRHLSHEENTKVMQLEIDYLKGSCATNGEGELPPILISFLAMRRMVVIDPSQGSPSESFLCDEDHHYKHRNKSPSCKGLGNDAIRKTLNQISRSPFMGRIEGGRLPRWFT